VPTYQYACTACDHRFEAVQSFSDASLTVCPACSGTLRKVFSSVGIVFKGSGFYRTDSRSGSSTGAAAKSENGSAASKGESGSDAAKTTSSSSGSGSSGASKDSSGSTTPAAAAS
jgi:putative FmdB family regulatory protein